MAGGRWVVAGGFAGVLGIFVQNCAGLCIGGVGRAGCKIGRTKPIFVDNTGVVMGGGVAFRG